jgi:hypothetical protein
MSHVLLTTETDATRALAAALCRVQSLAVGWLRRLGLDVLEVLDIGIEVVAPSGDRRADIHLDVITPDGQRKVIVEAKVDAPVDLAQLADASRSADHVISLVPADIEPPHMPGIVGATWEDALAVLRGGDGADDVSRFLADELSRLLDSPTIRRRRQLALLKPQSLPGGWSCSVDANSAGGDLLTLTGPDRPGGRWVSVEISDRARSKATPLRAQILVCSSTSATDPTVWAALGRTARCWPAGSFRDVVCGTGGRRREEESEAAAAHHVPTSWTYGYGQVQMEKHAWAGFGPRLELVGDDPQVLVDRAVEIAMDLDQAVAEIA